jgi:hypothetical protein
MKNEFQKYGYWWLSSNPEKRIAGILSFIPHERPKLKLLGSFDDGKDVWEDVFNLANSTLPPIIYGKDSNAKAITLIVVDRSGSWHASSELPIVDYTIQYCLIGIHLGSMEEKVFYKLSIELPLLTYWMKHFPLKQSFPLTKENKFSGDFDLSYLAGDNHQSYELLGGLKIDIKHYAKPPTLYTETSLVHQKYYIEFGSPEQYSLFSFIKIAYRFRSFLSIATLSDNDFDELILYKGERGENNAQSIELYFKEPLPDKLEFSGIQNHKFLFFHTDVRDEFSKIMDKWFSFDEKLLPIINHLVESIKVKKYFQSTDFLIIVQALEGYQRRFIDKNNHPDTPLEQRLKNLKNLFTKSVKKIRSIDPKTVSESRNYYSHFYNKDENVKILTTQELIVVTEQLKNLLYCCVLFEIGLSLEKISSIIDKAE